MLRQQLTQLTEQIDLLQRSQNTTSLQLDALLRERSAALYDMMDELDAGAYDEVSSGANAYLLAQNKLWIATGDSANFTDQVTALTQQAQSVQAQLGNPPRSPPRRPATLSGRPVAGGSMPGPTTSLHRTRLSSRRIWILTPPCRWTAVPARSFPASRRYVGVCSAEQGQKLLGQNGKQLSSSVQIRFPGQTDRSFKATVSEVTIDEEQGLARFVLTCNVINGDVLCLNHAAARISVGRAPACVSRFGGALPQGGRHRGRDAGRKLHPGVYVKYGNIARFCKIDPWTTIIRW